jgi:ferredoxin, 2Fe-2S
MPELIFIEADGTEHRVQGKVGRSVMENAMDNAIPGVLADCGGNCSCATCHGYVESKWAGKVDPVSEDEAMMLQCVVDKSPDSRLTCQIQLTEDLDGMVVRWPRSQV